MTVQPWLELNLSNMKTIEINAEGQAVGRVATQVAKALQGKTEPGFTPHLDPQVKVVVINAGKVVFTGRKLVQKDFRHHTMHPGGLKVKSMKSVFVKDPAEVMRHAVAGMLPKNRRRDEFMLRLTVKA